jgi:DNA primase
VRKVSIPGVRVRSISGNKVYCFCPFHKSGQERSPSMLIFLDSGRWKCHACSPELGDVRDLLFRTAGYGRAEAEAKIAELRSYAVVGEPIEERPQCPEYLLGPLIARRPLSLINKGYTREVLDEMEVGFDEARSRVAYPIRSPEGPLLGVVGGAVFVKNTPEYTSHYGDEPKYIAYGPREGFPFQVDPKWSLWNYHNLAYSRPDGCIVVVEGFKALLWVRMAGVKNVVALCGASFSQHQVELLGRLQGPYLLLLDNDPPGRAATVRLFRRLSKKGAVAAANYPRPVRQPDDLSLTEIRKCLGYEARKEEPCSGSGDSP